MVWGAALTAADIAKRLAGRTKREPPKQKPRFYAHVFADVETEASETEALQRSLESRGLQAGEGWPPRFTFGRGGAPGVEPQTVLFAVAVLVGTWTAGGFFGAIGKDAWEAIKVAVKERLERRKQDEFYLCVEWGSGQQVRALITDSAAFPEAWDALTSASARLPQLAPGEFCLMEWDSEQKRWTVPLG
jgi:hypothetical protein